MNEKESQFVRDLQKTGTVALCLAPVFLAAMIVVFLLECDDLAMACLFAMCGSIAAYMATVLGELIVEVVRQLRQLRQLKEVWR